MSATNMQEFWYFGIHETLYLFSEEKKQQYVYCFPNIQNCYDIAAVINAGVRILIEGLIKLYEISNFVALVEVCGGYLTLVQLRKLLLTPTTPQNRLRKKSIITAWKSYCNISWQDIVMELVA